MPRCGRQRPRRVDDVQLWDNADDVDEHHEHAHTRRGGKQLPTILGFKSTNDAMAAAIRKAKDEATEIVRKWRKP